MLNDKFCNFGVVFFICDHLKIFLYSQKSSHMKIMQIFFLKRMKSDMASPFSLQ